MACWMSLRQTRPRRKIYILSTLAILITVDSIPTSHAPPSIISSSGSRWARSSYTCCAVVGLTWPKVLALGAATGKSTWRSNYNVDECRGIRTPTYPVPLETHAGNCRLALHTIVNGPGQIAPPITLARAIHLYCSLLSTSHICTARYKLSVWQMRGSVSGLPLTS